jgi:hypothetical protein
LLLEPADLMTERRLGDVEPRRGTPEMKLFSDRDEVLDEAQVRPFDRRNLPIQRQPVLDVALPLGDDVTRRRLGNHQSVRSTR